jgi:hypothetical protein
LIDRYIEDGVLEHHNAAQDTRHLEYFNKSLGSCALAYMTSDLLLWFSDYYQVFEDLWHFSAHNLNSSF